jgi:hypothetical protein
LQVFPVLFFPDVDKNSWKKKTHGLSLSLSDVREPAAGVLASQLIFNFHSQDKRYPTEKEKKRGGGE